MYQKGHPGDALVLRARDDEGLCACSDHRFRASPSLFVYHPRREEAPEEERHEGRLVGNGRSAGRRVCSAANMGAEQSKDIMCCADCGFTQRTEVMCAMVACKVSRCV